MFFYLCIGYKCLCVWRGGGGGGGVADDKLSVIHVPFMLFFAEVFLKLPLGKITSTFSQSPV